MKQKQNKHKTKTKTKTKTKQSKQINNQRHRNNILPLERCSAAKHYDYHISVYLLTQCIWI